MGEGILHARESRWSKGLIVTGIVIAVLNMVLAWFMMFVGPATSMNPGSAAAHAGAAATGGDGDARHAPRPDAGRFAQADSGDASTVTLTKMFEFYQRDSQSRERQTTLLLGFCFALIAIGFSLFVMGIEGVADFKGDARAFGSLALKVGSPGIFCIFLAALLIALSLGRGEGSSVQPESKADAIRAEYEGKVQVLQAEAEAKQQILNAEAQSKRDVIDAETAAKERLMTQESTTRPPR
jgi:hypothetical protein